MYEIYTLLFGLKLEVDTYVSSSFDKSVQAQLDALVERLPAESTPTRLENDTPMPTGHDFNRTEAESSPLVSVLLERASSIGDPAHASQMICEAARVHLDAGADVDAARLILLDGFRRYPGSQTIADELTLLARSSGDWTDTLNMYQEQANLLIKQRPMVANALLVRAAAVMADDGEFVSAYELLKDVSELDFVAAGHSLDVLERAVLNVSDVTQLAEVFERVGDTSRAIRLMTRGVAMSTEPAEKAHFHHYVGVLEQALGHMRSAEWNFEQALLMDTHRRDSVELLANLYEREGKHRSVAELYERLRAVNDSVEYRSELACRAAKIYRDLGDQQHSFDLYQKVLDSNPESLNAVVPVLETYEAEHRYSEAAPLFEMLLRDPNNQSNMPRLHYRAGICFLAVNDAEKAVNALLIASEQTPDDIEILLAYATALQNNKEPRNALTVFNTILTLQDIHLSNERTKNIFLSMADAYRVCGENTQAISYYRRALEPGYDPVIFERLSTLLTTVGRYEQTIKLIDDHLVEMPSDDVVASCLRVADIAMKSLNDPSKAESAYHLALKHSPSDRNVLQLLVDFYSNNQKWDRALKYILLIADLETNVYRKAKYFQAAGVVSRNFGSIEQAAQFGNQAMDLYFCVDEANLREKSEAAGRKLFSRLAVILREAGAFKELERSYRKMIKRLDPNDPSVASLWADLGSLYKEHLGQRYSAISSYEVAVTLDESCLTNHRNLVDLYEDAGADHLDKAIERRYHLLREEPYKSEHYKALRSLYVRTKNFDHVWCTTRALTYLRAADRSEKAFYQQHATESSWPIVSMEPNDWALLAHVDEDIFLTQILDLTCEVFALAHSTSRKKIELSDDPDPHFSTLREIMGAATFSLGVPAFELSVQPRRECGISLANVSEQGVLKPAIVLGRASYEGRTVPAMVYDFARFLTFARRGYYLRWILSSEEEISAALCAAIALIHPTTTIASHLAKNVKKYRNLLDKQLHPSLRHQLAYAVNGYLGQNVPMDLPTWQASVDKTARRAGLLMSGNLRLAAQEIQREPTGFGQDIPADRLKDVLLHSVSPEHVALRLKLGLNINLDED